jgi:hypothetical protein
MAIKAIIATQFDATGIKKATKEFSKLGGSLRSTLGAVGIGVGLAAITNGLKESAKAAVSDVKSQALLAQQLRNTVGATDEAIAGSEAFIKSLMLQTSIADDSLRPALSTLVRATGDVSKAQSLLSLSTDIAAGTGKDLGAVSIAVGKAAAGQTTQLFRLIPALKGSKDFARDAALAFGGMAEAAANNDPFQRINIILGEMQEQIGMALLPTLNDFAAWFASPEGQAKLQEFVDFTTDAIDGVIKLANFIGENIKVLGPLAIGIGVASTAFSIFNAVLNANPIVRIISLVGLLAGALAGLSMATGEASTGVPATVISRAMKASQEAANATAKRFKAGTAGQGAAVATARKQAYDMVIKNYQTGIDALKSGVRETKAVVVPPVVTPTGTSGSKTKGKSAADIARDKALQALESFRTSMQGLGDFSNLTTIAKEVGQFEQSVTESFDEIYKKLSDAPAKADGIAKLKNFLDAQKDLLLTNAKQRDAIIEKRSLAKALFDDVKSSLMGTGSLASLLETQTKQVTTSVTKIIDGFTVTTRQTVDEVVGGKGVVSKLKEVVAKTKAFATQLTDLKTLGLNPDLFKQIVEAGPEVGGQLAKEILDGGSDSVKALNTTFTELQTVTAGIAEQTAVVMYNAGVDVAGGLVEGLLAQEAALVAAAQTLASAFNAAYQANIMALEVPSAPTVTPKVTSTTKVIAPKVTVKATPATKTDAQKLVSTLNKFYGSNPVPSYNPLYYVHA